MPRFAKHQEINGLNDDFKKQLLFPGSWPATLAPLNPMIRLSLRNRLDFWCQPFLHFCGFEVRDELSQV